MMTSAEIEAVALEVIGAANPWTPAAVAKALGERLVSGPADQQGKPARPGAGRAATGDALLAATSAAWDDNQRRTPYSSGQAFADLPGVTQQSWLTDHRVGIIAYLRQRSDEELARHGHSARWSVLASEIEQLEGEAVT